MTTKDDHVLARRHDGVGHITLNRPGEINALTHEMVTTMRLSLRHWQQDATIRTVVIDGAGERGLCAGEDIGVAFDDARFTRQRALDYWADQYRLSAEMRRYPKPIVALMDGVVMSGGVGISAHASHRVVNEDSVLALPELAIGLVPHVGGTHLLSRAPGEVGTHLALTTDRMDAADAIYCGFADHWVPIEDRGRLLQALGETDADDALSRLAVSAPYDSELHAQRGWIDDCYSVGRIEDILGRLLAGDNAAARSAADRITGLSPTAVKITLRALREARADPDLDASLQREFRLVARMITRQDVVEAVRARLIDRDAPPRWEPATLERVRDSDLDAYFDSLGDGELDLQD
jgi:enoyl-CoA hydratase